MLSQELVKKYFTYSDGVLYWKTATALCTKIGAAAGCIHKTTGYCRIVVNKRQYVRSNLVWAYHGNEIVEGFVIDHINGNKSDDRIENLQSITHANNSRKKRRMVTNKSGFTGVLWCPNNNNWRSYIKHNGKVISLGCYKNKDEAILARLNGAKKYYGEFSPIDQQGVK